MVLPLTFALRVSTAVRRAVASLAARWDQLAYHPAAGRDLRFDFLRGLAVVAMVVDHVAGPSRLYLLTGGNRFYTSAAEAFVFISGVVIGLAYRRLVLRQGLGAALYRLLARGWQLYVLAVGLTLLVLPISEVLHLPWAQGVDLHDAVTLLWAIVTLHQTYYLVDVPLLYALLLAVAPLAFVLLHEGRTRLLLMASWLLWAGYQLFPERTELPWPIAGNYLFQFAAWQVLFFTGMALGYHRERLQRSRLAAWRRPLLLGSGLAFVGFVLLFRDGEPVLSQLQTSLASWPAAPRLPGGDLQDVLFAKGDVRPGRIVVSAVVFGFLFLLTTELWVPLHRGLGWLLLPFGQNALYAYSAHVVAAMVLGALVVNTGSPTLPEAASAAAQLGSLTAIWLAIRFRVLLPTGSARTWWLASPLVMMLAFGVVVPRLAAPSLPLAEAPESSAAAAARQARRFGTPLPRGAVLGQPLPQTTPAPAVAAARGETPLPASVAAAATPVPPLPRPTPASRPPAQPPSADKPHTSEYVGAIRGTFQEVQFYSPALDRDMVYFVYRPPGYGQEVDRYPVLYMLHGGAGDKDEWPAFGLVDTLDRMVQAREVRPMIVVFPQGDEGYWVNHVADGPRWGDYVVDDLVLQVDATFRTIRDAQHRAIGGLSMGAFGALQIAFSHPEEFHTVGAHSPSLYEDSVGFAEILGTGSEYASRDPISMARAASGLGLSTIWIDIGEDDPWLQRAEQLHRVLSERSVGHDWSVLPGGHEGEYWEHHLASYLRFYDASLHRADPDPAASASALSPDADPSVPAPDLATEATAP